VVDDELLTRLRAEIGGDVEYAEPPARLAGGFFTANFRFSLVGAPERWAPPLVLRLFPDHAAPHQDSWEAAVQTFAHDHGVPAPEVLLHEPGSTLAGKRWFVMEMLPGSPAMEGIGARQVLTGVRQALREMPAQTAGIHLALHRVDPAPLVDSFGPDATIERWWSASGSGDDPGPLAPGFEWLRAHAPEPRAPAVLCHGDTWGGNVLVDGDEVTGLIDWSVATVAEPALDIGFMTMALSLAPVDMPRPLQRIVQRVGRRLARAYRTAYQSGSDADLASTPYYEALRCVNELRHVVAYRRARASGQEYDSPRPTWDSIADQMQTFVEQRTGLSLVLPPPVH
jgi:aminoglycoside phosphotransferase (APT) family kinase protein